MKKIILIIGIIINTPYFTFSQYFPSSVNYAVGAESRAVTSADFNGDGKIDLATANKLLIGNGTGGFTITTISSLDNNCVNTIVSGDFNSDGKLDLAMGCGDVNLLFGNGLGGFSAPTTISAGLYIKSMVSADFNNDGKMDIAVIGDTELNVLMGNGAGQFTVSTINTLVGNPVYTSFTAADFNGDGKTDIATAWNIGYINLGGYLSVHTGNGNGSFSAPMDVMTTPFAQSMTAADLNNDGNMDVATSHDNKIITALGNGSGGFTINYIGPVGNFCFITSGDYNNDGAQDLVLSQGTAAHAEIKLGNGTGNYSVNNDFYYYATPQSQAQTVVSADFNSDGKLDLATANYYAGSVSVFIATTLGIEGEQMISGIEVYPNPTNDIITIENKNFQLNSTYTILNSIGQQVLMGQLNGEVSIVDVKTLTEGIYFLRIGDDEMSSFKIMKK